VVGLSPLNRLRLYAVLFLLASHVLIIFAYEADRQSKISLSSAIFLVTAFFIVWRGRSIYPSRYREEV